MNRNIELHYDGGKKKDLLVTRGLVLIYPFYCWSHTRGTWGFGWIELVLGSHRKIMPR